MRNIITIILMALALVFTTSCDSYRNAVPRKGGWSFIQTTDYRYTYRPHHYGHYYHPTHTHRHTYYRK